MVVKSLSRGLKLLKGASRRESMKRTLVRVEIRAKNTLLFLSLSKIIYCPLNVQEFNIS